VKATTTPCSVIVVDDVADLFSSVAMVGIDGDPFLDKVKG
jgi:hypothetical protein